MKAQDLEFGKEYIFKQKSYSRFRNVKRGMVVDKTKKTIKINFENQYKERYEFSILDDEFKIIEEIEKNFDATFNKLTNQD